MSEFDYNRFVKVRASVIENGEARIKELEAELASEIKQSSERLASIARHVETEKHLRSCLKRLEWCVPDILGRKQCAACHHNQPGEGVGNDMVRGHAPDCWLAKELEGK